MADSTEQDDPKELVDPETTADEALVVEDEVVVVDEVEVTAEEAAGDEPAESDAGTVDDADAESGSKADAEATVDGDALSDAAADEPAAESASDAPAGDEAADQAGENDAPVVDEAFIAAPMEEVDEEDLRRPIEELKAIVEALVFASPEPLTPKALLKLLDTEPKEDVLAALDALKADYELRPGGLQLVEVAGGFQIVTRHDLHEWVRRLFHERSTQKLSVQALESLAVIAYRQPITALEVTEIRGVSASGVLNTLLERHLIKIVGRKQVVGRPFMYATTKEFLIRFGLKDLSDLPKVEDMAESLGIESSLLVEQAPPEEQLPLSEPDVEPSGYESADTDEASFAGDDASDDAPDEDPEPSVH